VTRPSQALPVGPEDLGQRLDRFLAEHLQLSRSQVRRLLERGAVSIEGRRLPPAAKGWNVREGSVVEVAPFERPGHEQAIPDASLSLSVLSSGSGWLAIDKPAGVPVHPLRADETGTLLNRLVAQFPEIQGVGEGGLRSGVVHRLDVDTSGALLFATHEEVWQRLRSAFAQHRVDKRYRALVRGRLQGQDSLEVGLVTARHRPARVRVVDGEELRRARGVRMGSLRWRSLQLFDDTTLLEVRPRTGFLHQIRVSLAHLGFPVLGDRTYGSPSDRAAAPRQMLHAQRIQLDEIEAVSPIPADFRKTLERLDGQVA
jgi:23S rRNA pseudouridine1911/1915/1917 synthase